MIKVFNNRKGFTLVEIILVIVVLSILLWFTFRFMDFAVRTYVLIREQEALYSDGTYIMERITRELSDAKSVTTPATGSSSPDELQFTRTNPSETVVIFKKSGDQLLRNGSLMGRNINKFDVKRSVPTDAYDETIEITLELTSPDDPVHVPPFSITTQVTPNNYGTGNYAERSFKNDYYENIK